MNKHIVKKYFFGAAVISSLVITAAQAVEPANGIVGKNEWLFYNYELSEPSHAGSTNVSLDLVRRLSKVFADNGVHLVVVMVPIKMRIYSEYLPDEVQINDYMAGNYARMNKILENTGVHTIDLNTAFVNSPKRISDTPLFFRLDTHWTPTGALLAAETIKAGLETNPALKGVLDSIPQEAFKMAVANRKRPSKGRDLIEQLPKNTLTFAPEMVAQVNVTRQQPPREDLLGNRVPLGITLVGSSYSMEWTGFTDALRYSLQRDILGVAVAADQGSWVGIESYLRDDAFQAKAPKLLIWEMPERDMRAPPDYKFRDSRYVINNSEWLLRASAWIQTVCRPSATGARLAPVGLAANPANLKGVKIVTGPTSDLDFIEIGFDKPIDKLDYLSSLYTSSGSTSLILEASGPGVGTRRFPVSVPGDDMAHLLKTPLPSVGSGFTKVRIFPGKSAAFSFDTVQLCRQPADLLK